MLNVLGDVWWLGGRKAQAPDWAAMLALPGVHLHVYGKADARPGRKMGHITITASSITQARAVSAQVASLLGLPT
jgi:5-(carboxyamino)imidazole ribonucleotide synthase